jgi:hypothetical protein
MLCMMYKKCLDTTALDSNRMYTAHYLQWKISHGSVTGVILLVRLACLHIEKLKVNTSQLIYGFIKQSDLFGFAI